MQRKVILYIAASLDGYIAKPDGDIDFLSVVEEPGEDYGYADFLKNIDTVIWGRKTYEKVLSFGHPLPHSDKIIYVITRTARADSEHVNFYTGSPCDLIADLKNKEGKNIFIDGGAQIVNQLLKLNLIDEIILSVIPVLLGSGIALFQEEKSEIRLKLVKSKQFRKGLVQLHYAVEKD
jgi:dihydrofolate reductase